MTISTTARKTTPAAGDSANKTWNFAFKVDSVSHLKAYLINTSTGDISLISSDYAWALNADQETSPGGTLTYPVAGAAITSTYKVQIVRSQPIVQGTDFVHGGTFGEEMAESALDRTTLQLQEIAEAVARAILLKPSSTWAGSFEIGDPVANYFLTANAANDGFAWSQAVDPGAVVISSWIENNLLNLASAAAVLAAIGGIGLAGDHVFTGKNDFQSTVTLNKGTNLTASDVSAGALTLPDNGNIYDFTDATNFSSIGTLGGNATVKIRFTAGGNVITHHATNLILPAAANYTTAAGDEFEFTEYAAGDWRVTGYALASGKALVVTTPSVSVRGTSRDLVVTRPSTSTITLTAAEVILQTSGGVPLRLSPVNQSARNLINAATSTTSGLDTGTSAPNTWYFVWLARSGINEVLLSSLSSSAPSTSRFPWSECAMVSVFRTDGSGSIINFEQVDDEYVYRAPRLIANYTPAVDSVAWTAENVAAFFPTTAKKNHFVAGCVSSGNQGVIHIAPYSDGAGFDTAVNYVSSTGDSTLNGLLGAIVGWPKQIRILAKQTVYWWIAGNNHDWDVYASGFTLR